MQTMSVKLILLLYITNCWDTAVCITCGAGWTEYDVSCYKYFSDIQTWEQARANCISLGSDLVVVKDSAESNFLHNTLIHSDVWLGLRDIDVEGVWVWIESGECTNYTNFNVGEPNNVGNEDCVELDYSNTEHWNDMRCSSRMGYVCEIFKDEEIPTFGSSCPGNVEVLVPLNETSVAVTWIPPTWTDNECVVFINESHSPGYVISITNGYLNASIMVKYTAYDRAGNPSETCSFIATASYAASKHTATLEKVHVAELSTMSATTERNVDQTTRIHVLNIQKTNHTQGHVDHLSTMSAATTRKLDQTTEKQVSDKQKNEHHEEHHSLLIIGVVLIVLSIISIIQNTIVIVHLYTKDLQDRTRQTVTFTNEGFSGHDGYDVRLSVVDNEVHQTYDSSEEVRPRLSTIGTSMRDL